MNILILTTLVRHHALHSGWMLEDKMCSYSHKSTKI